MVHEYMDVIISDRDKLFSSQHWQNRMKMIKCDHRLSTSNHQRTDGQTERKIQEIQSYLRNYLDFEQRNWIELIPIAQYSLNDAINVTTGQTPNFAVFGTERRLGMDIPKDMDIDDMGKKMTTIHENIAKEIEWNRNQQKKYYDQRRVEAPILKRGDKVYLKRRTMGQKKFNIRSLRPNTKLDHLRFGPFAIEEKLDHENYRLKLPQRMNIHPIFHISLLEKTENNETNEDIRVSEEEFDVEKIIAKRIRNGITEYRVKWLGCNDDENTWEPTKNLNCPEKIHDYEKTENQQKRLPGRQS